ncbi:MAG TPA: YtxH domain-containing protein [Candidatus Limnocylindria bacterium]|nr:YtxH domain-containing protein [Candidatus Limnocylindria bacterium]
MFSRVRIAIRFFFLGLAVGVLLAPRSGKETRAMVRERADRLLNDLLDAATLGAFEPGGPAPLEEEAPTNTGNGSGRSRAKRSTTSSATSGAQA